MTRPIYKYLLDGPETELPLSDADQILSVGMQDDQIVLWAIRNEHSKPQGRRFACVNTGQEAPVLVRKFIGTVTSSNGIVWHVFELSPAAFEAKFAPLLNNPLALKGKGLDDG